MADETPPTVITKSNQTLDLEARLARERGDDAGAGDLAPRSFAVEGNDLDGYIGVNPEYATYAEDTHKPGVADEGAEGEFEQRLREAPVGLVGAVTEPEKDDPQDPPAPTDGTAPPLPVGAAEQPGAESVGRKGAPARS